MPLVSVSVLNRLIGHTAHGTCHTTATNVCNELFVSCTGARGSGLSDCTRGLRPDYSEKKTNYGQIFKLRLRTTKHYI